MKEFQIQHQSVCVRPGKIISWAKPPADWIKLNCDGSRRGNPGNLGGGGIIRDCHGMEDIVAELEGVNFMVLYQYRKGNSAAYFLAKEGEMGKNIIYEDQHLLPRFLKGVLRVDRLGLPSF
ncbi:hypothetical protein QYF36_026727 [Acer negundo]|nr:hypothetical protein QYF36_026727 [Acer negundo]